MNITKLELCSRVARELGGNKTGAEIRPLLDTIISEVLKTISEGHKIEIRGFGSFSCKDRKKRIGRNPRTGDVIEIPEYKAPSFKFSREAQKIFNNMIKKTEKNYTIDIS